MGLMTGRLVDLELEHVSDFKNKKIVDRYWFHGQDPVPGDDKLKVISSLPEMRYLNPLWIVFATGEYFLYRTELVYDMYAMLRDHVLNTPNDNPFVLKSLFFGPTENTFFEKYDVDGFKSLVDSIVSEDKVVFDHARMRSTVYGWFSDDPFPETRQFIEEIVRFVLHQYYWFNVSFAKRYQERFSKDFTQYYKEGIIIPASGSEIIKIDQFRFKNKMVSGANSLLGLADTHSVRKGLRNLPYSLKPLIEGEYYRDMDKNQYPVTFSVPIGEKVTMVWESIDEMTKYLTGRSEEFYDELMTYAVKNFNGIAFVDRRQNNKAKLVYANKGLREIIEDCKEKAGC